MGDTSIQWTDKTRNPVRGCSRISEGCRNCYAEKVAARFSDPGQPSRIFVNSMSDLFHENLPIVAQERIFRVMLSAPQHSYQVLTKRADLMAERVPQIMNRIFGSHWSMPDFIWLGVSVEDQPSADRRIRELLRTPAAKRFVSYEPALAAVDFRPFIGGENNHLGTEDGLDWVIVGGESGPGARPFDIQWARNTIAQCGAAGVACFVKQLGSHPQEIAFPIDVTDREAETWHRDGWTRIYNHEGNHWRKYLRLKDRKGGDMSEWPEDLKVREFPR